MSINRLFFVLLMLFCSTDVHGRDNFSWEMFLPAVTNLCTPGHLEGCKTRETCEGRGGYWYNNSCHREPAASCSIDRLDLCTTEKTCIAAGGYWYDEACHAEPLACNATHLDLCLSRQECIAAGGYWYGKICNPEQSPNAINTAKLAGEWYFVINLGKPDSFNQIYIMDGTTVKEYPVDSGIFTIAGTDQDGDPVSGKYVQENDNYTMYVTKTGAENILYEFTFSSPGNVGGCYYLENKDDGTYGPCLPMLGEML